MWNELLKLVQNQLFAGGFLLMITGSVIALLKDIPKKLYSFANHQFTSSVKITDESSSSFMAVAYWIQQQRFFGKVRHTDVRRFKNELNQDEVIFIPAEGSHWFFYNWRLMWFSFSRTEAKGNWDSKYNENFSLGIIGRNKEFLKNTVRQVTSDMKKRNFGACLKTWDSYWKTVVGYSPRALDSVILPAREKQLLTDDIQKFLQNEKIYTLSGTPYRRGYLFHGLPGTGKTSLIAGLSSHFKKDVYLLHPQHLSDEKLSEAIADIPARSVVVIEDVDCVTSSKSRKAKDKDEKKGFGVTLSGLLNCLDGLKVPHGLLFFLTTNHVEKLDPALIRPGRVDFRFKFGLATKEQKEEYFQKFLSTPVPADMASKQVTMAEVQQRALAIQNGDKV